MEMPPEELETVTVSRLPTTVITVNGSIDTTEEATVYVKDLDMFVTNSSKTLRQYYLWENSAKKMGVHMTGNKVKHQIFLNMASVYLAHATTSCLSSFLFYEEMQPYQVQQMIPLETLQSWHPKMRKQRGHREVDCNI